MSDYTEKIKFIDLVRPFSSHTELERKENSNKTVFILCSCGNLNEIKFQFLYKNEGYYVCMKCNQESIITKVLPEIYQIFGTTIGVCLN